MVGARQLLLLVGGYACAESWEPDNHTPGSHVHVDNVFLAWAQATDPVVEPVHRVRWFTAAELADAPEVAEDSRLQAKELMELIAAGQVRLPE
ncbi:hypothetical protein ACOZ38_29165 [Sphaerisporangium viridialbum]|uniref:hypothetical protein n=1 Tax=Sphaerisporangium viridialbum TaxID=46189 RepID=UPI003C715517